MEKLKFALAAIFVLGLVFSWNAPSLARRGDLSSPQAAAAMDFAVEALLGREALGRLENAQAALRGAALPQSLPSASTEEPESVSAECVDTQAVFRDGPPGSLAAFKSDPDEARPDTRPPTAPRQEPAGSWTLAFYGDSLANGYAAGALRWAKTKGIEAKILDRGRISTGIVASSYHDWPSAFGRSCPADRPTVAAFSFGANDTGDMRINGRRLAFGSSEWIGEYRRRVSTILAKARECGTRVLWILPPPMRQPDFEAKMAVLRTAQEMACSEADRCLNPFEDLSGNFSSYEHSGEVNGKRRQIRASDGIHMTPEGYFAYLAAPLEKITAFKEPDPIGSGQAAQSSSSSSSDSKSSAAAWPKTALKSPLINPSWPIR